MSAMTYRRFVKFCQRKQLQYINEERRRMEKADRLLRQLKADFAALGLHVHSADEIRARRVELDGMERAIPETHKDDAVMRWSFERYQASVKPSPYVVAATEAGFKFHEVEPGTWRWTGKFEDECRDWSSLEIAAQEACAWEGIEPERVA